MRNERVRVADGIDLSVDRWDAAPDRDGRTAAVPDAPAPTFLLVHGLASNARLWDGVAARLTELGHLVVTVDLRGHGRSAKPDAGYDVPTVAGDLGELIERLALERPIVAGQSWGGNVALELGRRSQDALRGLVLVDGGWLEPSSGFADWDACLAALAPPRLVGRPLVDVERHIRSSHPDWPETGIQGTLANFEVRVDGTIAPWLTYDRHIAILRGLWDDHPAARYAEVRVPTLLVAAGTADQVPESKRAAVEAAGRTIPKARVVWMAGDHDLHAQHPGPLADLFHGAVADGFFR